MKRCPECRRDYYDDSLLYCLDDGTRLLDGPGVGDEHPTRNFDDATTLVDLKGISGDPPSGRGRVTMGELATSPTPISRGVVLAIGLVLIGLATGGFYWLRPSQPAAQKQPVSQTAYDNYMRAKVLVANESDEDNQTAIGLLEQAVKDDPQYGAAWATLARAYNIRSFYYAKPEEMKQLDDNAKVAVEKALAIDPNLAEAHLARGVLLWTHANRFQHEVSVQSLKKAIELDPKLDEAHHQLGLVYFHIGLFDKAEAEISKAIEINPANSLARYRFAVIDMYRGRYDEANRISQSTPLDKSPSLRESQGAMILFRLGRIDEAEKTIDAYLAKYPVDQGGIATSVKAMILAKRGSRDAALAAIARSEQLGKDYGHFHHTAYNIACVYAALGMADKAVDYLQMAADDGFPCYPLFERDELLKPIGHEARFVSLLAELKQQWERYNATL